jgi:hypothetical protein
MNLFTLAENLHMTVERLRSEMPLREFFGWLKFYAQRREEAEGEASGSATPQTREEDPAVQMFSFLPGAPI